MPDRGRNSRHGTRTAQQRAAVANEHVVELERPVRLGRGSSTTARRESTFEQDPVHRPVDRAGAVSRRPLSGRPLTATGGHAVKEGTRGRSRAWIAAFARAAFATVPVSSSAVWHGMYSDRGARRVGSAMFGPAAPEPYGLCFKRPRRALAVEGR